jgi:hypothetical protein
MHAAAVITAPTVVDVQSYQAVAQDICESLISLGLDAITMPDGADLIKRLADEHIELVGGRAGRRAATHDMPSPSAGTTCIAAKYSNRMTEMSADS